MGDFYELIFDEERKASQLLDITLTQRCQRAGQIIKNEMALSAKEPTGAKRAD